MRMAFLFGALIVALYVTDVLPLHHVYDLLPVHAESLKRGVVSPATSQVIVVTGKGWGAASGTLWRYERDYHGADWRVVATAKKVSLGQRGFAWGIGLHDRGGLRGPEIDEGDRRTPAGVFRISGLFGFEPTTAQRSFKMPYHQLSDDDFCVDDPASAYYNQIVVTTQISNPDWRSGEPMRAGGYGYQLAVVYDQNPQPVQPRRGSCYFLHIGPNSGGGFGCTTLDEKEIQEIAQWLDPSKAPLLVQLPEKVYLAVQEAWGLPPGK